MFKDMDVCAIINDSFKRSDDGRGLAERCSENASLCRANDVAYKTLPEHLKSMYFNLCNPICPNAKRVRSYGNIKFSVNVLTTGSWPSYPSCEDSCPAQVTVCRRK